MALVKGTNSYATVEEADIYFDDRLDVAAWTDANSVMKSQALITATSILDDMSWTGLSSSETQTLAFPRTGVYLDTKLGYSLPMSPTPTRILRGTFELAYHLLNNEGLADETGSILSMSVSSINMTTIIAPNKIPNTVMNAVRPLLVNNGSNSWWRAN